MKRLFLVFLLLSIAIVPAAMADSTLQIDLTNSNIVVTDLSNISVTTASDLPYTFNSANGLTQTFDAFDISSQTGFLGDGSANVAATFTFGPAATSDSDNPITGTITGDLSQDGSIAWNNGGAATIVDSNGDTYTLALLNTNYGWNNDDVQATLTETSDPAPALAPEPASIALFGSGLLGLAGFARRRFLNR